MDAVYILGSGSVAENKEILYSVRSLFLHMLDLENVYVIGEKPELVPGAIHILADDPYKEKWKNALHKTKIACAHPDISEDFVLMNDDFFALQPFNGFELDFFALKNSNGGLNGQHFFGIHCPIRINKEWYSNLPLDVEMKGDYSPRSFYCNFYKAPPRFISDVVIRTGENQPPFKDQIRGLEFFSVSNDAMLDSSFVESLGDLYDIKSPLESL